MSPTHRWENKDWSTPHSLPLNLSQVVSIVWAAMVTERKWANYLMLVLRLLAVINNKTGTNQNFIKTECSDYWFSNIFFFPTPTFSNEPCITSLPPFLSTIYKSTPEMEMILHRWRWYSIDGDWIYTKTQEVYRTRGDWAVQLSAGLALISLNSNQSEHVSATLGNGNHPLFPYDDIVVCLARFYCKAHMEYINCLGWYMLNW